MTWLANNPEIVHAVAVGCAVIGLGLMLLWLVGKAAEWYRDRHERRRWREIDRSARKIIAETEEPKP